MPSVSHAEGILYAASLSHLKHHQRFYAAFVLGIALLLFTGGFSWPFRLIAVSDTFFVVYLFLIMFLVHETCEEVEARAAVEDEGILLVVLILLAAVGTSCVAIITIPHHSHGQVTWPLIAALAGAPLGWFTLHVTAAFHYANLYYAPVGRNDLAKRPLAFPGG